MSSALIGALRVSLGLNSAGFEKGLTQAQRELQKTARQFQRLGRNMSGVGKSMSTYLTLPFVGFGALSLKTAGDFEASMNKVRAVSGATGQEFEALKTVAKEMGATTQYSASQSADALSFLAMAGFDANEAIDALPSTLELAAAAQMDLADSADIVSNVLSGYGMDVSELSRVNDVLVKTFTSANTDLRQLGEAMKYAGPVANAAGVEFEAAAAAMGLMGNAGIQASMAGTSLRGSISRILSPTAAAATAMKDAGLNFKDAAGKLLPLDEIIQQLEPHAEDAGLFMEIFGQRAGPAMAALVSQGSDALVALTDELKNSGGTAQEIAAAQMEGFNGAMKRMSSAFEALQIAIAESGLLDMFTGFVENLAALFTRLSETNPKLLHIGVIIGGIVTAIGPLLMMLGPIVTMFGTLSITAAAAGVSVGALIAPIALTVAGIAALAASAIYLYRHWDTLVEKFPALETALNIALAPIELLRSAFSIFVGDVDAGVMRLRDLFNNLGFDVSFGKVAIAVNFARDAVVYFAENFQATWDVLTNIVAGIVDLFRGDFTAALDHGKAAITAFGDTFIADLGRFGLEAMNSLIGAINDGVANAAAAMINVGREIVNGIRVGIDQAWESLKAKVSSLTDLIPQWVKDRLGIASPSKVMAALGHWIPAGLAVGIEDSSSLAVKAAGDLADKVESEFKNFKNMLSGVFDGFLNDLTNGDIVGAFKNAFGEIADYARQSFTNALKSAFAEGSQGLQGLLNTFKSGFSGLASGISGLFSGGGFGGLLQGLSGAMPLIGGIVSGFNLITGLIKGFSSSKVIGGGLNLGIKDGDLIGNQFKKIEKSTWWGLRKKKKTKTSALDDEFAKEINGIIDGIQGNASDLFDRVGLNISDAMIDGVEMAMQTIDTHGLSDSEVKAKVEAWLGEYQDTIVQAFTGYSFEEVATYSNVQQILAPLGMQFDALQLVTQDTFAKVAGGLSKSAEDGFGAIGFGLNKVFTKATKMSSGIFEKFRNAKFGNTQEDVEGTGVNEQARRLNAAAIEAANALAELAGGTEALASKVGAFIDGFFSDQEKLDMLAGQTNAVFADLGIFVPQTAEEFKQLVLSQDLMTEAGREAYNALLQIAPQMRTLFDDAEAAANAAAEALAQFNQDQFDILFDLLPEDQQLDAMRAQLESAFSAIGESVPATLGEYRNILAAFDNTQSDAFYSIRDLVSVWEEVHEAAQTAAQAQLEAHTSAVNAWMDVLKTPLTLDADKYASEYEATMAAAWEQRYADIGADATTQEEYNAEMIREMRLMREAFNKLTTQQRNQGIYGRN